MSYKKKHIIGIDASRNRSGGAKVHLIGILSNINPEQYNIGEVHVWSYKALLDSLPDYPWLQKHCPDELQKSLFRQLFWQRYRLPVLAKKMGCQIMLNTDAGTVSRFRPAITMSRDMLSYEPGEIDRYGISLARLRLLALRYVQNSSLRKSDGTIFLTKYAAETIQKSCGPLSNIALIPHGVEEDFHSIVASQNWPISKERSIRCLYISNADLYKHQWHVVKAIEIIRKKGIDLQLELVGGGKGKARDLLENQINKSDPYSFFVKQHEFLPRSMLPGFLSNADLFIFASSCENMPNTLIEAMAAGLPIACSNRGPMPEVLKNGGEYFNPEDPVSIAEAVEVLINDENRRNKLSKRAKELSRQYSWKRCSDETFSFIVETIK